MMKRDDFLNRVKANIAEYGYHVTVVTGGELPRFAYTIGCTDTIGTEFVFAGGEFYSQNDIGHIIHQVVSLAKNQSDWQLSSLEVESLGVFATVGVDNSWSQLLTLGVSDFYARNDIPVWQIIPDSQHHTLDVPDMSQVFDADSQPVWQWLSRKWDYPVPSDSMAATDLQVLFGKKATEVMRWEDDEWEIFSDDSTTIPKDYMRMVTLGTLLGIDDSLRPMLYLEAGKGLWRDENELTWNDWG